MVVDDFLACPLVMHSTSFGITEQVDVVRTDAASDVVSRHFHVQIRDEKDLDKIRMPEVSHNSQATAFRLQAMQEVFGDLMPVRTVGQSHIWFTPWDYLVRWWGIQEAMLDLVERPALVHAGVERMVDAWMCELDQFEKLNLLALDNNNTRIGSGGYGYTSALPAAGFDAARVRPRDMWGCSNAQIFSEVSPAMHWEFAIKHDLRWLARWGLTYYGCCEGLHRKVDLLRRIPNLRKISCSPWAKHGSLMDQVGGDYVLSFKPNPAVLATDRWNPGQAREDLRRFLDLAQGRCHVEIIMKDISTVRHEPQRLWEWARIASEEAEAHAH
jgi:hypothetical protein